jgi:two-component system NtrC family sensor kinase
MEPISSQRILVIDDEPAMHADFRAVLAGDGLAEADSNLDQLEASMFGQDLRQAREGFEIESAHQGIEGLELARAALAGRRPFTVAFVDMRMPPGWDGLRTVKELWRLDPRLQVVICTAYSDHSCERLEQHVAERTRQLRDTQQELVRTARRAGMAEIATNVLHNVGNTLNSINVAAELMRTRLAQSRSASLSRAVDLLDAHQGGLGTFFTEDEKGRVFPRYLRELDAALQRERQELATHLDHLAASIDHVKKVVATQQTYAGPSLIVESVVPAELVEDALRISLSSRQGASTVQVVRQMADTGPVLLDRTRVLQVLINLLDNAYQAMTESGTQAPVLTLQTLTDADRLVFVVRDTGCGIAPENLTRIFSHGFTTRAQGHGFGLHGCALAAGEMGGRLTAHSAGPAQGAAFTLDLPLLAA